MALSFSLSVLAGLLAAFHCVGMCGGILGALGLSTPQAVRQHRLRFLGYVLAYNLGRVVSYSLIGLLVGAVGSAMADTVQLAYGHLVLRVLGAAVMLGMGLHLAGWFPQFKQIESIGRPVWRRLEPLARRLMPVRSISAALAYGMVWGWLPCGLVYSMLVYAATSADAKAAAAVMFGFGLGTLPVMLVVGLMFQPLMQVLRSQAVRRAGGILVCLLAFASLLFAPQHRHVLELEPAVDTQTDEHSHH